MPDVRQVPREPPRHDEDGVDPDVVSWLGETGRKRLGGGNDAAEADMVEREVCFGGGGSCFHLDKGQGVPALGDEIDFPQGVRARRARIRQPWRRSHQEAMISARRPPRSARWRVI